MITPNGFSELVEMVGTLRFKSKKPEPIKDNNDMWRNFCWSALLKNNRTEAEVNYVCGILDDADLLDRIKLTRDWLPNAKEALSDAKDVINDSEPNAEGKIGSIKKIESDIIDLETTLKSADEIFKKRTPIIDADYLRKIALNTDSDERLNEEKKLICDIASPDETCFLKKKTSHRFKIPGIAYTKSILWMHGCGIGLDFIPDNNHSIKFLKECDEIVSQDFFVINGKFQKICNSDRIDLYYGGYALWIYESSKNLVQKRKMKQLYNPYQLIKIMNNEGKDINDFAELLGDIEGVLELEEILNYGMESRFL